MRQAFKIIKLLCGLFVLYITAGSTIGFALPSPDTNAPGCFPYGSTAGVFVWQCTSAAADWFWAIVVGWPRFVIVFPAIAFALLKAAATTTFQHLFWPSLFPSFADMYLVESVAWLMYTVPLAIVIWVGFAYWKTRSKPFAIALTATLLGEILYLGFRE